MKRLFEVLIALLVGIILAVLIAPYAKAAAAENGHCWNMGKGSSNFYFDGEISYAAGYQFYNAGSLDDQAKAMGLDEPSEGMVVHNLSLIWATTERVSIGITHFWGRDRTTGGMNINGNSYNRELTVGMSGGGFILECTPVKMNRFELATSIIIGGGTARVTLRQDDGTVRWGDAAGYYSGDQPATSISNEVEREYFLLRPGIKGRYFLFDWMALEGKVGWQWDTLSSSGWTYNLTELSGDGPDPNFRQPWFSVGIAIGGN